MTTKDSILNLAARVRAGEFERTEKRQTITDTAAIVAEFDRATREDIDRLPESFLNLADRVALGEFDVPGGGVDAEQLRSKVMSVYRCVFITPPAKETPIPLPLKRASRKNVGAKETLLGERSA